MGIRGSNGERVSLDLMGSGLLTGPSSYKLYLGDKCHSLLTCYGGGPVDGEKLAAMTVLGPRMVTLLRQADEALAAPESIREAWLAGVRDVLEHVSQPALLRRLPRLVDVESNARCAAEEIGVAEIGGVA